ncbi:hypothetical protein [Planotetraspora silvatica]|nr:hypothetical protein [Planotetraspora silvatica]
MTTWPARWRPWPVAPWCCVVGLETVIVDSVTTGLPAGLGVRERTAGDQ